MNQRTVQVAAPPDGAWLLATSTSIAGKTLLCIQPQFGHFLTPEDAERARGELHPSLRKLLTPIQIRVPHEEGQS